jgi:hypothetical protein
MRSAIHSRLMAAGVEEEFHIVDLTPGADRAGCQAHGAVAR